MDKENDWSNEVDKEGKEFDDNTGDYQYSDAEIESIWISNMMQVGVTAATKDTKIDFPFFSAVYVNKPGVTDDG
jgi:hypothetical protein